MEQFLSLTSAEVRRQQKVKIVSILDLIHQIAPLIAPLPDKIITKQAEDLQTAVLAEKCSREEKESSVPALRSLVSLAGPGDRASGTTVSRELITKRREERAGISPVTVSQQAEIVTASSVVLTLEGGEVSLGIRPTKEAEGNSISRAVSPVSLRWAGPGMRRRTPISTRVRGARGTGRRRRRWRRWRHRGTPGGRWRMSSRQETAGWRESSAPASSRTHLIPPIGLEAVKSKASLN